MGIGTMVRQVRISEGEWAALTALSAREGVPPDSLVREALKRYLAEKDRTMQTRRALRQSFGIWKDRNDLRPESVDLVNELREGWGERARRLGLD